MSDRAAGFRALHERDGAFLIPNPWDVGSARMLAGLGFEALATTSAGMAFAMGEIEGRVSRPATLAHIRALVDATPLPVSADLEKGFGDSPESAAETIRAAAATGIAGASLEDHTGDPAAPIFDHALAVERIAAAVEARDALGRDLVFTARAENYLWGRPDLDDTIRRLQAFEAAGADVLYAPGLPNLAAVREVCAALTRPVNVIVVAPKPGFTVSELAEAGVRRISVGSGFARLAFGSVIAAAEAMLADGEFDLLSGAAGFKKIEALLKAGDAAPA